MSRNLALLCVLVLLTGCSVGISPTPPPTLSTSLPGPPPRTLTRVDAVMAVAMRPPPGFQVVRTCRSGERQACRRRGTERARWLVGTVASGAALPDGNGPREQITTIVMAWPSPAKARRYVSKVVRQLDRYRGDYDVPLKTTGPRRYTPGERGKGEIQRLTLKGWRGVGVRRTFVRSFYDHETSGTACGGRFVMRRGPYVADVEWVARSQTADRRRSHLPARLIRALP